MACFLNALPDDLRHVGKLTNAKSVLICKQLCKPSIWLLQGMHVPTCGVLYIMLLTQSCGEYVVILQLSGYIQLEILNCCAYNLLFNVLPVVFFTNDKFTNTESVLTWKQLCKPSVCLL